MKEEHFYTPLFMAVPQTCLRYAMGAKMRKIWRILPVLFLAGMSGTVITGCSKISADVTNTAIGTGGTGREESAVTDEAAGEEDLFTLRVITQTGFNELNVADELGFFKEEGIQLTYIGTLGKGITEFQLIEQGEIDAFTGSHPPNVAQARLAGVKVKAVAPGMVDNEEFPHVRYLVQEDSRIQFLDDLSGQKVSISGISACTDGYIKYYLKKQGLPSENIEWVTLSTGGQQEQSLMQGQVAVTTSHPPYAGKALAAGGVREIATSWDIFKSPGAGLSVRGFHEDFINEHPKVVQGFVNAMYKARVWINANQQKALEIVAKYLKLEPEDMSIFWYDENRNITPGYIDQWFEIAESIELWKAGDIEPEEVYINDFIPE